MATWHMIMALTGNKRSLICCSLGILRQWFISYNREHFLWSKSDRRILCRACRSRKWRFFAKSLIYSKFFDFTIKKKKRLSVLIWRNRQSWYAGKYKGILKVTNETITNRNQNGKCLKGKWCGNLSSVVETHERWPHCVFQMVTW